MLRVFLKFDHLESGQCNEALSEDFGDRGGDQVLALTLRFDEMHK